MLWKGCTFFCFGGSAFENEVELMKGTIYEVIIVFLWVEFLLLCMTLSEIACKEFLLLCMILSKIACKDNAVQKRANPKPALDGSRQT